MVMTHSTHRQLQVTLGPEDKPHHHQKADRRYRRRSPAHIENKIESARILVKRTDWLYVIWNYFLHIDSTSVVGGVACDMRPYYL